MRGCWDEAVFLERAQAKETAAEADIYRQFG
jgi:hypothetical protein